MSAGYEPDAAGELGDIARPGDAANGCAPGKAVRGTGDARQRASEAHVPLSETTPLCLFNPASQE